MAPGFEYAHRGARVHLGARIEIGVAPEVAAVVGIAPK